MRKEIGAAKRVVPFCDKLRRSASIIAQVELLPQFMQCHTILAYWSMEDEVQTHDFVERWYREKCILLPCVSGNDLVLRRYEGTECMVAGEQFGIGEPSGEIYDNLEGVEMIVVPGVAFDRQNHRMGRGRGFYDRLLKSTPNAYKVGVCFDFQMVDNVPVEPFDVPMDEVVVEMNHND